MTSIGIPRIGQAAIPNPDQNDPARNPYDRPGRRGREPPPPSSTIGQAERASPPDGSRRLGWRRGSQRIKRPRAARFFVVDRDFCGITNRGTLRARLSGRGRGKPPIEPPPMMRRDSLLTKK